MSPFDSARSNLATPVPDGRTRTRATRQLGYARTRTAGSLGRLLPMVLLGCLVLFTACRTADPVPPPEPVRLPAPEPTEPVVEVVGPSAVATNSLDHVTYTFDLPRRPERGYIIEESFDGEEWFVYGRSDSTNLRQVTIVDATPASGKKWRIKLP